jgi:hypothetical protein
LITTAAEAGVAVAASGTINASDAMAALDAARHAVFDNVGSLLFFGPLVYQSARPPADFSARPTPSPGP